MKKWLKSLRLQILLPMLVMTVFVVALLSTLFSRAFIQMILQQEQAVNAAGFETISHTVPSSITTAINSVRDVITDQRVISCIRLQFASAAEMFNTKAACIDYLREKITHADWANGLFIMREDGSLFGTLPDGNYFHDDPEDNPLPNEMKQRILDVPMGQIVWVGPVSGADMYGFENKNTPRGYLIAAWRAMDVRFGECWVMMLIDQAAFDKLFSSLEDGKSTWRIITTDQAELYHTGSEPCGNPEQLIGKSNSGNVFTDESGRSAFAFSMTMTSPQWTMVREVSTEESEQVIRQARRSVFLLAAVILLIALVVYELWLRKFTQQYKKLVGGITRMGQEIGPLEGTSFFTTEFETIKQEINKTSQALQQQMETIRQMTAEKERISTEMNLAREIQASVLPMVFPPFPERNDIDLYASMTPAKEVGGDFYDFFMVDDDHLALVIADVSGKGSPASLFMMIAKSLIKSQLLNGCDPARAMERVNRRMLEGNTSSTFVTVWAAVIELTTGQGLVCNAGHEHPAIRCADAPFELLKYRHNMFVGVSEKARYQNRAFEMRPGDCLFVYTDGVPEAQNANKEMFGEGRLIDALNQHPDAVPEELLSNVRKAVDDFVGEAPQFDDLTMLAFRYNGVSRKREHDQGITTDESVYTYCR